MEHGQTGNLVKWTVLAAFSAALAATAAGSACALASEHPAGQTLNAASNWPDGLMELVNCKERVYGYFVNFWDYFYFEGDTASLNAFLQKLGDIRHPQPVVTIHPGTGMAHKLAREETFQYDWSLSTLPEGTPVADRKTQTGLSLDVWLGDGISLDDLKVPLSIEVRSGGEIEQFVKEHKARNEGKPDAAQPTD